MLQVHLPDPLIEVDNRLGFTQHLTAPGPKAARSGAGHEDEHAQRVCEAVAAVIAYGCNLGPHTMAQLTAGVSYAQIKRVADWQLHEEPLRKALGVVVSAILKLETAKVWGEGRTSSSDGHPPRGRHGGLLSTAGVADRRGPGPAPPSEPALPAARPLRRARGGS